MEVLEHRVRKRVYTDKEVHKALDLPRGQRLHPRVALCTEDYETLISMHSAT